MIQQSVEKSEFAALNRSDAKLIDFGLSVLSPRWTSEILIDLASGPKRTTQLLRDLEGVSAKTLCQRLRKLSELSLVSRATFAEVPPRVEYSLTKSGTELTSILNALKTLGSELATKHMPASAMTKAACDEVVDVSVEEFGYNDMSQASAAQ
ncbi:MAG: helix-turn-helix transcriptional regulator [Candidatus Obscuribacter sp.]|jgi:DNA-binding HxlR family transcriptional regulator|nr:helix-turn-helix transcriptional regulator [Candidatus Obscuribacter sp.]MDQ5966628.1 hypothetical protein [Cyanobacteriota bacterium erpe_2018_sw_39hr_WHONDRS-SW48-000098_B_bin.30]MBK9204161.1 helix-turn-helix transcriptional regulator [Candidatus Obscuribacter sp.]MBK9617572.1 helix-turn-helix transcriptional regulator [Candidatus Obscuribacter sp.]MBK9773756.1 helix-turn-helix transcriptional regulator [Candidatus Obscuribacter sp.]